MDLSPGAVVAGRYRADRRVGSGGMGEVWAGEHVALGVPIAMKALLPAAAVHHEIVARFKREAYLLGRVRSDHVARVLDFVADDAFGLVLVMEYVQGESLAQILQRKRLGVEEAIELGTGIVNALCDLHASHIIHRDLKPGNILVKPMPDGTQRAIVVDFGVSRLVSEGSDEGDTITGITRADMAVGTLEYMAPEQVLSSRDVTAASDLYAVGALLYRAVAGRHIFGNVTDEQLARKKLLEDPPPLQTGKDDPIGRGLEAVVARAIRRRPAERYAKTEDMLGELITLRDAIRASQTLSDLSSTEDTRKLLDGLKTIPLPQNFVLPSARPSAVPAAPSRPPASAPVESSLAGPPPSSAPRAPLSAPPSPSAAFMPPSVGATVLAAVEPPPPPRGIPFALVLLAVGLALGGGLALGTTLAGRAQDTAPPASALPLPAAAAAPAPVALAPERDLAPAATASAAPPDPAAAAPIDLGDLDMPPVPAATAAPWPRPRPAASFVSAAPSVAAQGAPAQTAAASATPAPSAAATSAAADATVKSGASAAAAPPPAKAAAPEPAPAAPEKIVF
jgi:serine/threonine-protein kinase